MNRPFLVILFAVLLTMSLAIPGTTAGIPGGLRVRQGSGHALSTTHLVAAPSDTPRVRPMLEPGLTVIWPNGSVSNSSAPLSQAGPLYTVTAGFTGGLLDERNGSTINGDGMSLNQSPGLPAAVEVFQANGVIVENLSLTHATIGIYLDGAPGAQVEHDSIIASSWAVWVANASNVSVESNTATGTAGVLVEHDSGVNITANSLAGARTAAVDVSASSEITILRNHAAGSVAGVLAELVSGILIEGNDFSASGEGLSLNDVTASTVVSNVFMNSTHAIHVGYSSDVSLTADVGNNATVGVEADSVANLLVNGESFSGSTYGLFLSAVTNVTVTSNSFVHDVYGATVENSNEVRLTANNLSYFAQKGVWIEYSSNVALTSNTVQFGTVSGGRAFDTEYAQATTLTRNLANHNSFGEFDRSSGNLTLLGNSFGYTAGPYAAVSLSSDSGVLLLQNFLYNASYYGIEAGQTEGFTIAQNNVSFAGYAAISIVSALTGIVTDNRVDHAYEYGLFISGSNGMTVTNNPGGFTSNRSGVGIYVAGLVGGAISANNATNSNISLAVIDSSGLAVLANNASESLYGIWLDGNVNTTIAGNEFYSDTFAFWARANSATWVYHNNFVGDSGWTLPLSVQSIFWDAEYPQGGNYWSDHTGPDSLSGPNQTWSGSDGLVDTPMRINASNIDHLPLVSPWPGYSFIFTESGLASSTTWGVVVNGVGYLSPTTTLVIPEVNGPRATYQFAVPRVTGYFPSTPSSGGPWPEARSNISITIAFIAFLFPVQFQEFGLPNGTVWSVVVGSHTVTSTSSNGLTLLSNGTYPYIAGKVDGYKLTVGSGSFVMSGTPMTVLIIYSSVTPTTAGYSATVVFGLAAGMAAAVIIALIAIGMLIRSRERGMRSASPWHPPRADPGGGGGASPPEGPSGPPG
jgi:nitrous oxidase accessory protein NosD